MNKNIYKSWILLITYSVLLITLIVKIDVVLSFVGQIFTVLIPLFIGVALAFILNRPFKLFKRVYGSLAKKSKNMAKTFSLITVYLMLIGIVTGIIAFLIPQLLDNIDTLYNNLGKYSEQLSALAQKASRYLNLNGIDMDSINAFLLEFTSLSSNIFKGLFSNVVNFTTNALISVLNIVLGIFLSVYILADKDRIRRQFVIILSAYLPIKTGERIKYILHLSNKIFTRFVSGQLIEALILGVLCFIGMTIFRFNYPILISVIIAVTSLIPVAGPIIGAIPAVFILLMAAPLQAIWFIVFITILQQLEGNIIYPKVVGDSIGLPALWVLLAIIIGGGLMGVMGMLLSVPTASVLYQLIKEDANKKHLKRDCVAK